MNVWVTFIKERIPIPVYALLTGGFVFSGMYIAQPEFSWLTIAGFIGTFVFLAQLRLMDESKDYEKDVVANPGRPLPRGLLKKEEVLQAIKIIQGLMYAFGGLIIFGLGNTNAGIAFITLSGYLWLMYKEFYMGKQLSQSPILYAVTHQIIILILVSFTVAIVNESKILSPGTLAYGMVALGGFFTYEVCRKLNPNAHEILGTYLRHYGPKITFLFTMLLCGLSAYGAHLAGYEIVIWPLDGIMILSASLILFKPEKYKIVEGVATLSLIIHLWSGVIMYFIN